MFEQGIIIAGWFVCAALIAGVALLVATSIHERRWRPVAIGSLIGALMIACTIGVLTWDAPFRGWIVGGLVILTFIITLLLTLPIGRATPMNIVAEQRRIDEREAVFHRFVRMKPGTPEWKAYYAEHPEKEAFDAEVRKLPGLTKPGHATYHSFASNYVNATFDVLEGVTRDVDWAPEPIEGARVEADPAEFTRRIKGFAHFLGAELVGVCELNPAYVYSHIGRSPGTWGEAIDVQHPRAIAIAVEMRHDKVRHAPDSITTTETAIQYFEAAKIAMILAKYINLLGYEARSNVDGNYRVMCPPIAVDAGLGEVGRLGLLITRKFGPRVRLSVVTTDLPLVLDAPDTFGVQEFCTFCKKCGDNCPSDSIDMGDKAVYAGVEKWQTNRDTCFKFWRQRSSDCAVCVNVCPYAHPGTFMHNMMRWMIARNRITRRIAYWGDDLLYGRRPQCAAKIPDWHQRD